MSRITIITVCKNEEKNIRKTIESVLCQTFTDYEYIIKDGNSFDQTNEIIELYRKDFENKGIKYIHITSDDYGIYNAMNIASKRATGEWINFMNAGDSFYNDSVLFDVFYNKKWDSEGILYGHTLCEIENGGHFVQINNHNDLIKGEGISQQSCFIRQALAERSPFAESYIIMSDFDFLLKMLFSGVQFRALNNIVANYNRKGISSRQIYRATYEKNRILQDYTDAKKIKYIDKVVLKIKNCFTKCFPLVSDYLFCIHRIRRRDMNRGGGII